MSIGFDINIKVAEKLIKLAAEKSSPEKIERDSKRQTYPYRGPNIPASPDLPAIAKGDLGKSRGGGTLSPLTLGLEALSRGGGVAVPSQSINSGAYSAANEMALSDMFEGTKKIPTRYTSGKYYLPHELPPEYSSGKKISKPLRASKRKEMQISDALLNDLVQGKEIPQEVAGLRDKIRDPHSFISSNESLSSMSNEAKQSLLDTFNKSRLGRYSETRTGKPNFEPLTYLEILLNRMGESTYPAHTGW